ncbi:unnamed protein product [marine sediment metagenome]|uniref:Resolvase/invertase-type recombinase catalytic domain-containing protein n=1 Tax=marine sediment metagenome TaxID=412755 RepID=X1LFV7_9ZZZZ
MIKTMKEEKEKETSKPKALGYVRVSTREQAEKGISLEVQRKKIRAYADLKDLDLVKIIADKGKSGKDLKRKGIRELLEMIKSKEVSAVITYKMDRLSRRVKDQLYLAEDVFVKNKISLVSLTESIDTTTAQGRAYFTITGAFSQMERDLIAERTADALEELKKRGRRLGGPNFVAYGLKLRKKKRPTLKDLKIDLSKIKNVREMRRLRKRNWTLEKIGEKFGKSKSSIKYILENPIYKVLKV